MIGKFDKPPETRSSPLDAAPFALPSWSILSLHGADALAFAQAQLMNDIQRLHDGDWQWNGWLNPKGRVIALCMALRRDAETLWLLLPDMPASELADALKRFVFRSKLELRELDDWRVAGCMADSAAQSAQCRACITEPGLSLDFGALPSASMESDSSFRRQLLVLPVSQALSAASPTQVQRWLHADVMAGLPHLPVEFRETYTPQMLALDRLRAYSVKKGCYPGQEIVSRTHFLGAAKRRLQCLRLPPAIDASPGDPVLDGKGTALGNLINVARCDSGHEALAVLGDAVVLPISINQQAVERIEFFDLLPV